MSNQKYPQTTSVGSGDTAKRRVSTRTRYSSIKLHAKRDRKRREADIRQSAYDALSTKDKLKALGDTGSTRQRNRLTALLAAEKASKVKTAPLTSEQKGDKQVRNAQDRVKATARYKPSDDSLEAHASVA